MFRAIAIFLLFAFASSQPGMAQKVYDRDKVPGDISPQDFINLGKVQIFAGDKVKPRNSNIDGQVQFSVLEGVPGVFGIHKVKDNWVMIYFGRYKKGPRYNIRWDFYGDDGFRVAGGLLDGKQLVPGEKSILIINPAMKNVERKGRIKLSRDVPR